MKYNKSADETAKILGAIGHSTLPARSLLGAFFFLHFKIRDYGTRLLKFGMFYLEYSNAIREDDGNSLLSCWWYLLLITKSAEQRKILICNRKVLNIYVAADKSLTTIPPRQT